MENLFRKGQAMEFIFSSLSGDSRQQEIKYIALPFLHFLGQNNFFAEGFFLIPEISLEISALQMK